MEVILESYNQREERILADKEERVRKSKLIQAEKNKNIMSRRMKAEEELRTKMDSYSDAQYAATARLSKQKDVLHEDRRR